MKRQKFPDIPVESIASYSGKRLGASRNKYEKNFTGANSSMRTHARSLSGWPSGELQEVRPVRVSRRSPLMAPPFSGNGGQSPHTKLPAGQHPSNSNLLPLINTTEETWRRGFRCLSPLEPFPHILHSASLREAGDGRRDRPRNVDMRSSTPIIVPLGSC